jgi:hypothetical protein
MDKQRNTSFKKGRAHAREGDEVDAQFAEVPVRMFISALLRCAPNELAR